MTDALKPCHCCGSKKAPKLVRTPTQVFVWCDTYSMQGEDGCGARSGLYATDKEAIAAWNTRASDTRIAELEAENERLRKDAERYRWLRDTSVPPHNFYISVPDEFHDVRYQPREVDQYIDKAIAALKESERVTRAAPPSGADKGD